MEIRLLTADDTPAYSALRLEALEMEPEAYISGPEDHRALTFDELRGRLAADAAEKFTVGAFAESRLVGMATFARESRAKVRHKANIYGVYASRDMRGRRIGRMIIEALLDRAAHIQGVEQMVLEVTTTQSAAVGLYRSFGFETFGCQRRALRIDGRYLDVAHMVLYFGARPEAA